MINLLSWYQFYRAGDLLTPMGSLYKWNFILEIKPDVEPISPSLEDNRFPCLARFSHNELSIPVILLKEEQDTMVCMLLEGQEVSYEYAALFGEPLDEQAPPATLHLFSDSVYRLPASGIHYPESLYTGVWIHAGTMLEHAGKMVWESWEEQERARNQIITPSQIQAPVNKGAIAGCLVITIGLVALVITFFAFMVSLFL
ncbi:hypothetical protein [Oceanimonas baumannii]|uniref:Uncharacterized protein n=1 Tax=Oceanimonas baumannii TaxID=129578 RepID=A0A235CL42_9GAMM|nr:hypothetical protein [Oceanimonas baumannii]OYD25283.1 hypothetical protein B6S09_06290 [Oceanimonas baumannii]TDW62422.1 hypothetical protein LY04_00489 [Oceanimonas baumannii]